jgi:hypothetical protein
MVIIGAGALLEASKSFSIVQGRVVAKELASVGSGSDEYLVQTISVVLESEDRVYSYKQGSVAKYPVSSEDSRIISVGSEVRILVTAHPMQAKLLDFSPGVI